MSLYRDYLLVGTGLLTLAAFASAWLFPVWPGDAALLLAVQERQSPALTAMFRWVTYLGWMPAAVALTLAAVVGLLLTGRRYDALFLGLGVLPSALTPALKLLVGRPRPEYALVDPAPQTMAFPSGHAAFAMLLAGILIYLVWLRVGNPWLRGGLCAVLALLIALVGASRVYLGVHWPSDVIGGYLYAGFALLAASRIRARLAGCGN